MKTFIKAMLLISFILLLTTCSTPFSGNDAVITINLGTRSAWPHETDSNILEELLFYATFTNENEEISIPPKKYGERISTIVNPGEWQIYLVARHKNMEYATGESSVLVTAGRTHPVTIYMQLSDEYDWSGEDEPRDRPDDKEPEDGTGDKDPENPWNEDYYHRGDIIGYEHHADPDMNHIIYGVLLTSEEDDDNIGYIYSEEGEFYFDLSKIKIRDTDLMSAHEFLGGELFGHAFSSDDVIISDGDTKTTMVLLKVLISFNPSYLVKIGYEQMQIDYSIVHFIYVDRATTIEGTHDSSTSSAQYHWYLQLSRGWNMVYEYLIQENDNNTFHISSTQPSGFEYKWLLWDEDQLNEFLTIDD